MTKNLERKKKEQIKGRTNRRSPIFNPTIQLVIVNLYTKYKVSIFNGCGDIFDKKNWKERKRNKQKEEQIGECPFAIPRYNLSLWTCIPNMKFLSKTVVEISLTKNLERKKKGQTQGRTNRRMPICNPTIQLVVVDLYTKYEVSIFNGCGDIFDEKVLRNYGRTDGRTDGTTDRCKPVYPPLFQSGGIMNHYSFYLFIYLFIY